MGAPFVSLHDRERIEAILRRNTAVNIYGIGDLDPRFWPRTVWYALDTADPQSVALLYLFPDMPTLLLLEGDRESRDLLAAIAPVLPARLYAHLHPDLVPALDASHHFDSRGLHHKMALADPEAIAAAGDAGAQVLGPDQLEEVEELYRESYPGNWFDPRMLETGQCVGIRREGQLASIAGVHVYSPAYRVAALGNITTRPALRGRGLGRHVTAACCQGLLRTVDIIGLNVKADNEPAIRCYRRLGFTYVSDYVEGAASRR